MRYHLIDPTEPVIDNGEAIFEIIESFPSKEAAEHVLEANRGLQIIKG
ncbi:hypothetical protein M1M18_gp017 [Halorubrum virus Serpecor1]|uniref:Uncharacterized protein n=1 Tax=Halorubrum virus Serpecor1 TaxID=2721757 RepID=A0A6G9RWC1_9CAUD|nr:hypothetical protein M1M18_gp017 [Halorubrum virus Serpecor1]QIR31283.1 hypothetical protein HrrSp1_610 [Halorubrum virus Serpecor1]